jgi:virulence-associated protein VagC
VNKKKGTSATAALVCHGVYQYVRLPKHFRFAGDKVQISKSRDGVILKPLPANGSEPKATAANKKKQLDGNREP